MVTPYCPVKGDIIWLDLFPQTGREVAKRRPALVLSPFAYNRRSRLCVMCPLSSHSPRHLFEVPVTLQGKAGSVLVDQVKSLDWQLRTGQLIEKVERRVLLSVLECLQLFLFDDEAA